MFSWIFKLNPIAISRGIISINDRSNKNRRPLLSMKKYATEENLFQDVKIFIIGTMVKKYEHGVCCGKPKAKPKSPHHRDARTTQKGGKKRKCADTRQLPVASEFTYLLGSSEAKGDMLTEMP
jgi:hypothetical protein